MGVSQQQLKAAMDTVNSLTPEGVNEYVLDYAYGGVMLQRRVGSGVTDVTKRTGKTEMSWYLAGMIRGLEEHDCENHAVPYESEGEIGHGWECNRCGKVLQAG